MNQLYVYVRADKPFSLIRGKHMDQSKNKFLKPGNLPLKERNYLRGEYQTRQQSNQTATRTAVSEKPN